MMSVVQVEVPGSLANEDSVLNSVISGRTLAIDNACIKDGGLIAECNLCGSRGLMLVEHEILRETVRCGSCGSFSRQRALGAVVSEEMRLGIQRKPPDVLLLESSGALFRAMRNREFVGEINLVVAEFELGAHDLDAAGPFELAKLDLCVTSEHIAHERFDLLIHADVYEHVQDLELALRNSLQLLRPGGVILFTVPLDGPGGHHLVRAEGVGSELEYREPPVWHGDPNPLAVDANGTLVYTDIGVHELSAQVASMNADLTFLRVWDLRLGVIGQAATVLRIVKSAGGTIPSNNPWL